MYGHVNFSNFISESDYKSLHTSPLVPLDIKINIEQFQIELAEFDSNFKIWGEKYPDMLRYGLPLTNEDGILKNLDPANYPNDEWNSRYPDRFLTDADMVTPTPVLNIPSLSPLKIFDKYLYRSNILKWGEGGCITPHIDTLMPSPYLRLWGTTDADNIDVNFFNVSTNKMEKAQGIESGRIYLIDTSIIHEGICISGTVYQFFICLSPLAKDLIKTKVLS